MDTEFKKSLENIIVIYQSVLDHVKKETSSVILRRLLLSLKNEVVRSRSLISPKEKKNIQKNLTKKIDKRKETKTPEKQEKDIQNSHKKKKGRSIKETTNITTPTGKRSYKKKENNTKKNI